MLSRIEPGEERKGGGGAPAGDVLGTVVVPLFLPWRVSVPFGSVLPHSYTNCYLAQGQRCVLITYCSTDVY